MKQVNWDTYLFHCSSLPMLMSNNRQKGMGEKALKYLKEVYIEEVFDRKKYDSANKYTKKGIEVESDSLELVSKVRGGTIFKNTKTLSNSYLVGTPDVIKPHLIDIKSSWDIWTFFNADEKKAKEDYYWQMQGYMILTGQEKAELTYVLVDTPPEITEGELYKMSFNLTEEEIDDARRNFSYPDIAPEQRIRSYEFTFGGEESIVSRVHEAREYLKTLAIN